MSSLSKIRITLLLLLLLPAGALCNATPDAEYKKGRRIFETYCKVCHGENGDGKTFVRNALKTPPADFTAKDAGSRLSPERMKRSILFGRAGTAMVSWKNELSQEEINDVILFIRINFMKTDRKTDEAPEKSYEDITKKYSARINAGRGLYQKHCFHCHGEKGDSQMPVNGGLKSPPRNFTDPLVKETLLPEQMFYSIRDGINGTAMVSWRKEFSDREIVDIIRYIQTVLMGIAEVKT